MHAGTLRTPMYAMRRQSVHQCTDYMHHAYTCAAARVTAGCFLCDEAAFYLYYEALPLPVLLYLLAILLQGKMGEQLEQVV